MSKFVHMELSTSDPEAAQKFYKAIFGWKYQKMKMADGTVYVGIKAGEEGIGGLQKHPIPGAPPSWLGYVGVDSVKRTIAKVEKNGGKVMMPQMDIPGMGSLAIFTDPQGAAFAIWQPSARPAEGAAEPAAAEPAPAKKVAKKATKKAAAKPAAVEAAPAKKASKKTASKKAAAAKPLAAAKKAAKKSAKSVA
jgi:predicted enzyme related to lactoylglutathione lyase